jgi:orotidine-5'-phosphate decarboxylase
MRCGSYDLIFDCCNGRRVVTGLTAALSGFSERLHRAQDVNNSLLCVGLDPDLTRFPASLVRGSPGQRLIDFNRSIIDATSEFASCFKPNLGFYLPLGHDGIDALIDLRMHVASHIPVLLDAKVGDINTTTAAYARAYFDEWGFDAVTANPFMGHDSIAPLLDYPDRGVFLLAKTSNPGSGFLQDREIVGTGEKVSHLVARSAVEWNERGNLGLVIGATYPDELGSIRAIAHGLPILVPGVGAQSGELEASVAAGIGNNKAGLLINASRAISYASSGKDFQNAAHEAAKELRNRINAARFTT